MQLFNELKRRNVFRVAFGYVVSSWLLAQVADLVLENIGAPEWVMQTILLLLALGFPVVVFFSWAYEVTPEGIKRESEIDHSESTSHITGRKLDRAIMAVLVVVLAFFAFDKFVLDPVGEVESPAVTTEAIPGSSIAQTPQSSAKDTSIAVLPLVNMSAIDDNVFFAGGVHEEILTNLSRIEGWLVVSRTTAMRYINSDLSLRDIGRELGVRYIVEGSVRRVDNHVRVTVQLIDASNDTHVWASNYDRELVDVFATQSAVAREITNSLHLEIEPESVGTLEDMPTQSVRAYDLYMKARSIDRSEVESEAQLSSQRELLEQAIAEDPNFVEAWGYLNEILDDMIRHANQSGWFIPQSADRDSIINDLGEQSQRALNKAVALDPDNIETLLALASDSVAEESADFRLERKKVIDKATEMYPDNAMAWYVLGWWYNLNRDNKSAKSAFEKALELDPLHARIVWGSLIHFRFVGDQEMVTLLYERLAQIAPEKGEDRNLAQATTGGKLWRTVLAFIETADQSLIDEFANTLSTSSVFVGGDVVRQDWNVTLWELNNQLDEFLAFDGDVPLGENPTSWVLSSYVGFNLTMLKAHRLTGHEDKANVFARRIIATEKSAVFHGEAVEKNHAALAIAYATLGERDRAQEWIDRLLNNRSETYNAYSLSGFLALAELDPDRAASLLLAEKAEHPTWDGVDYAAAFHVTFREIIVHPDMQEYFLKEGKWIDYLAERVPEYAKYQ